MVIKTPLADDVFKRWLASKPSDKIKKKFGRKSSEISAMEVVGKEIHKSPALIFTSTIRKTSKSDSIKKSNKIYTYKDLSKQKFYKFNNRVNKNDWKEKNEEVTLYEKIESIACKKCQSNGYKKCRDCDGLGKIECKSCRDSKKLVCRECDGKGSKTINIEIIDEKGKKSSVERKIKCPKCHGKGKFKCTDCGDSKSIICKRCKGTGGEDCSDCEGIGTVYHFPLSIVPFGGVGEVYFFWNNKLEKEISKSKTFKGKELLDLLQKSNVQPIKLKPDELNENKLEEELGYWDKEAAEQVKECRKTFEDMQKGGAEEPKLPIELYPLQKIDIETYTDKKFSIFSIGSENGYIVFDLSF